MRTIYLLSLVLCISCSKKSERSDDLVFHKPDQIDYYYLKITEKEVTEIFKSENMSRHERQLAEILYHIAPTAVNDTAFIGEMDEMPYFDKTTIDKKSNHKILQCFAPYADLHSASFINSVVTCAPTYRDVLVFRKQKKIVGFAKVCFECSQTHLVGSEFEAVHTDYASLKKTLESLPRK